MKTKVKRRQLGKTGIAVSEVSFGSMNLRTLPDAAAAEKLVNDILDQGINLIDTARAYDTSEASHDAHNRTGITIRGEVVVGRVVASRTDIDEPLVIVTKGHGYTPETFDEHLGQSLERLQIRREGGSLWIGGTRIILIYLLHGIKEDRWPVISGSGVLAHAEKRRQAGDFHFLGFSSHYGDSAVIKAALESGAFHVCELTYNVYNPSLGEEGETDLIELAHRLGIGVINMKAFNGNGTAPIFMQLSGLTGIDHGDMLRFCLSNPHISTVDAGARSLAEFLADVDAAQLPALDSGERARLRERAKRISPVLDSVCRECMHCVEKFTCPQGIDFPRILGIYGRYSISRQLDFGTDVYRQNYAGYSPNAASCLSCGNCLEWCEYKLNIPELMRQADEALSGT